MHEAQNLSPALDKPLSLGTHPVIQWGDCSDIQGHPWLLNYYIIVQSHSEFYETLSQKKKRKKLKNSQTNKKIENQTKN